ncbi:MAG: hypothetical protein IPG53_17360 [Ignavibacteriales bacterium]|nr:hypothetical protein [Ignavibacteriales bacterium]
MRYQSKSLTGLIQLVSLIFIFYNVVINAQFLNNSGLSSLVREYIILDSSKLPSNQLLFSETLPISPGIKETSGNITGNM